MTIQEKALALINRCDFGMLGNNDEQGNPQIKAMIKTKNEGLDAFWFCSNTSSKRAAQIKKDGNACNLLKFMNVSYIMAFLVKKNRFVCDYNASKTNVGNKAWEK